MKVLLARNVNDLMIQGLELLAGYGQQSASRNGPVVVAPYPVMSVYERPTERVLFDAQRDANPFFHLMEGLWMLAGRNDAEFLNRYIKDFGDRFAEPDGVLHGAYGHRWRHVMGFDQLNEIVRRLSKNPDDRQCVLQMWDAADHNDAWSGGIDGKRVSSPDDLQGDWKDRPCNTHVYFRMRPERKLDDPLFTHAVLDMTICCRSNDVVWGAYGANAVHFSMLQEYMAGRVGVSVGTMYQLSNNFHGYVATLDKMGDPTQLPDCDRYNTGVVRSVPMAEHWQSWDKDLAAFMRWHGASWESRDVEVSYVNSWFYWVPVLATMAYQQYRGGRLNDALNTVESMRAPDWRMACREWLQRRVK